MKQINIPLHSAVRMDILCSNRPFGYGRGGPEIGCCGYVSIYFVCTRAIPISTGDLEIAVAIAMDRNPKGLHHV